MDNIFVSLIFALLSQCSLAFSSSGIPGSDLPKHIRTGYNLAISTNRDHLNEYVEAVRPKLSQTLIDVVPGDLILSSGFLTKDQDPLDMAGCYIRLGQHLRQYESLENKYRFASVSFLNAGSSYGKLAFTLRGNEVDADTNEIRINFLVSAAQCYYWAFCNEPDLHKKAIERSLSIDYLRYARYGANLLTDDTRDFWFQNIDRELAKLL
jgi:hypothetical protein